MKKFEPIYKVIKDFPDIQIRDHSYWRYPDYAQNYTSRFNPLFIVLEDNAEQKRLWITKSWGKYSITVANTKHAFDSHLYSSTQKRYNFRAQREMADCLQNLLRMTNKELFGRKTDRYGR